MSDCIYCRGPTRNEPEEHIFPEGLVGDTPIKVPFPNGEVIERRIVLYDSEVCKKCNIALGRLDQHLQQQLGLFKVLINRDKTKGGRSPRVEKPGMIAKRDEGGICIHLNLTNKATKTPDGMIVAPVKNKQSAVKVTRFTHHSAKLSGSFTQVMKLDKLFVRSLYKIGFELLCLFKGHAFVCNHCYDSLRQYIKGGIGKRQALIKTSIPPALIPGFNLTYNSEAGAWIAILNLGAQFLVDLSPSNIYILRMSNSSLLADGYARIGMINRHNSEAGE
jgi:hypothetical protein